MVGRTPRYQVENRQDAWVIVDALDDTIVETFGRTELQRQRALRVALGRNLEARFAAEEAAALATESNDGAEQDGR
jgi:hypothetical protein